MSGTTILTDVGRDKLATAAGSGAAVEITHIALGDADGAPYDPLFDQTALVGERARIAIASRWQVDGYAWVVTADVPGGGDTYDLREMAFLDQDGDAIALWAGADAEPDRVGISTLHLRHVLDFGRVADGVVMIAAPDDALVRHMLRDITAHAIAGRDRLSQKLELRALRTLIEES
ncbi:MAG: phage tail-collar fiber domain-containing protein [Shimia sp.]